MIEAVIFDWAGTTVDYGCFAPVNAFKEAFESIGITVTAAEIRKPMGVLKKDHIVQMLEEPRISKAFFVVHGRTYNEDDVAQIYAVFEESLFADLENYAKPINGVVELVKWLREKGIKIGSTTGYTSQMMKIVSKAAETYDYAPDCIVTPDIVGVGRPNPEMIQENLKRLNISSLDKVIKVGDTIADIKEGKNAGVISVGVIFGSSELGKAKNELSSLDELLEVKNRYSAAGADYVLQEIGDLRMLIETLE